MAFARTPSPPIFRMSPVLFHYAKTLRRWSAGMPHWRFATVNNLDDVKPKPQAVASLSPQTQAGPAGARHGTPKTELDQHVRIRDVE